MIVGVQEAEPKPETNADTDAVVERAAQALFEDDYSLDGDYRWDEAGDEEKDKHRRRARIALGVQRPGDRLPGGLKAMPEHPTDRIVEALCTALHCDLQQDTAEAVYRAVWDAAGDGQ